MATLNGQQINNSYQGLLKTEDNAAISGLINITDGLGNQSGLFLDPTAATSGMEGSNPFSLIKNTNFDTAAYPMAAGGRTNVTFQDVNGVQTFNMSQDRWGSSYFTNLNGQEGEQHIFTSQTPAGGFALATISMNGYNNPNNSNNWYTGYQQSVNSLAYNSGTGDLTLGRQIVSDLVVNIPTGGVVDSIVAGTNVTVDATDPANPIVSATGGGGAAGLVNGTGTDSLQSAASLTTNPANANAQDSIALGNGAQATGLFSMAHGKNSNASAQNATALGPDTNASGVNALAIGQGATAENDRAISIGDGITNQNGVNISIGAGIQNLGQGSHAIGPFHSMGLNNQGCTLVGGTSLNIAAGQNDFCSIGRINSPTGAFSNSTQIGLVSSIANSTNTVVIGRGANATSAGSSVSIGRDASINADSCVAIGRDATVNSARNNGLALGRDATVDVANGVAIGAVTATRADFVTMKELELKTVGGGIIMPSPDGTLYKVTVANGGTLTVSAV